MLQSHVPETAGELASEVCTRTEPGYLATVQDLCHKHSALFVLDVLRVRSLFSQVVDCRRIVVSS